MGVNYETHRDIVVFILGCSTTDGPMGYEMDIILFMHVNHNMTKYVQHNPIGINIVLINGRRGNCMYRP